MKRFFFKWYNSVTCDEMNVKAPNDDILKKKGLNWYSAILDLLCSIWILTFWATDTYSILIILKENIFMQILSAEKKIKILNIAFSSTYISHYTEHAIFLSWCVKYQDYFIFILCITLQFFLYHKIHASWLKLILNTS